MGCFLKVQEPGSASRATGEQLCCLCHGCGFFGVGSHEEGVAFLDGLAGFDGVGAVPLGEFAQGGDEGGVWVIGVGEVGAVPVLPELGHLLGHGGTQEEGGDAEGFGAGIEDGLEGVCAIVEGVELLGEGEGGAVGNEIIDMADDGSACVEHGFEVHVVEGVGGVAHSVLGELV